ncbi:GNAT family N-acetyltransferase [Pontibacter akesuensis]|nr:GNAT family N-acetyltransferase [Pontibacter akesuensis]
MPNFRFTFLTAHEMSLLRQTFLDAFADYVVPIQLSETQFQTKLKREGIAPEFCVAAYVGDEMAGFILTGLGEWEGKPTAYNAGTGVKPMYRGHRLTEQLYAFLLPKLRESGVEQCLLEVIQDNKPALKSYERTGMRITRSLDCFRSPKQEILFSTDMPDDITLSLASRPDWKVYDTFKDVAPTWQNNSAAIKRSGSECVTLEAVNSFEEVVGVISFFPKLGTVAQLAVDARWRDIGVGSALLREAVQRTEASALLFINIDHTAKEFITFLERRHFKVILRQYEMLMAIV